jgi:hypothetical protein
MRAPSAYWWRFLQKKLHNFPGCKASRDYRVGAEDSGHRPDGQGRAGTGRDRQETGCSIRPLEEVPRFLRQSRDFVENQNTHFLLNKIASRFSTGCAIQLCDRWEGSWAQYPFAVQWKGPLVDSYLTFLVARLVSERPLPLR